MLTVYLLLLIARAVTDLVMALRQSAEPPAGGRGSVALLGEVVYTSTDPPLHLLRRIIPPLRLGKVAFDLGFLLLFIVIVVLRGYAQQL